MTSIYRINHTITLTSSHKDELATALTDLHTTTFDVARLFVQIHFRFLQTPSAFAKDPRLEDDAADHDTIYIGGLRQWTPTNHIEAEIAFPARVGQSEDEETTSDAQNSESQRVDPAKSLISEITAIWRRIVLPPVSGSALGPRDFDIHSCTIRGPAVFASYVEGVNLPGPKDSLEYWKQLFQMNFIHGLMQKREFDSVPAALEDFARKVEDGEIDGNHSQLNLFRELYAGIPKKRRRSPAEPEDEESRRRRKEEMEKAAKARQEKAAKELEESLGWGEAA